MNLIDELNEIDTNDYSVWIAEWWTDEDSLNLPHWEIAEEDPEVSDEFLPTPLWLSPEHY